MFIHNCPSTYIFSLTVTQQNIQLTGNCMDYMSLSQISTAARGDALSCEPLRTNKSIHVAPTTAKVKGKLYS